MARKSEIRQQAKAALDALVAAANSTNEQEGNRQLGVAITRLSEAAGVTAKSPRPSKATREGEGAGEPTRLLERMGIGADGFDLVESERLALLSGGLLERMGLDRDELEA